MGRRPYGWIPSLPDHRDRAFRFSAEMGAALPASVDLRPKMPLVYDQGDEGSCTANATAAAVQFLLRPSGDTPWFTPARAFIYWNTRAIEGSVGCDSGGTLRDAIKSVASLGVCAEAAWPYVPDQADDGGVFAAGCHSAAKPSQAAYDAATAARAISYHAVPQDLLQIKACLAAGFPAVFGFSLYDSFYGPDGQPLTDIPMPGPHDALDGGHAVVLVGYDDATQRFTARNSWGVAVQNAGHFTLPYAYVTDSDLASDFWTIRSVAPV